MGDSVGQVSLDLVLNKGDFEAGLNSITRLATKAGKMLAGAFAVGKLISFGKECIELSSNLSEVQNVVDTVFPTMNKQIDNFAKNAAAQFGLSETMAKNFTGTFGAMGKAFGFSEGQAYGMATALTGLAGDVASFYNMSQDEAYTKLKSVFTGETESLKSLGVVMTQTALDAFAMANGFGKTTKSMSEAEKVALRFKFVQDRLSAAQGDFMRTSDGWANQVRLLSLQFDSLKAAIGSGLIAVLSPVVRMLNILIGRILTAISALRSFFSMLGGTAKLAINPKGVTAGTDAVAKSADKASGALGGAGGAAKKAAKDIKSATTGIDELNILPDQSDSSGGGSGGEGGGGGADFPMESFDTGAMEEGTAKINEHLQGMIDRFNELKNLFMSGFWEGLKDTSVLDSIKENIKGIGESLVNIFTSSEVLNAANTFADRAAVDLGKIAGAGVSIGLTFVDFLSGSVEKYLAQNTERIKKFIVKMFDIEGDIADIQANFAVAIADIFSVLQGDNFKQIGADIISIVSDILGTFIVVSESFFRDSIDVILTPVVELKDRIIETYNALSEPVMQVFNDLAEIFHMYGDTIISIYDNSVHPLFTLMKETIVAVGDKFLDSFGTYILPIVQKAADKFTDFKDNVIAPLMPKFEEVFGKISECIQVAWTTVIEPFIIWFTGVAVQQIGMALDIAVNCFFAFLDGVGKVVDGVLTALGGLMDFIIGVLTGDWDRAWNGIKAIFDGIWRAITGILEAMLNVMHAKLTGMLNMIKKNWEAVWKAVSDFFKHIFDGIKSALSEKMEAVKNGISTVLNTIKENWEKVWTNLKTTTISIFEGMWGGIKGVINSILGGVESMANGVIKAINSMINSLNSISFELPDWIPEIGGNSFGLSIPTVPTVSIPKLANGGFVKANTPQLAMIGDNRHYGEVVAPENKLEDMLNKAVSLASNPGISEEHFERMLAFLSRISEQIEAMDLTVYVDVREIKQRLTDLEGRSGYSLRG